MLTRTTHPLAALTLAFAATLATATSAAAATMAGPPSSPQDVSFATKAAQGGLAEVAAARFALSRTIDAKVRAFAMKMIADHTKANEQLIAIAKVQSIRLPSGIGPSDAQQLKALQPLHGTTFDAAYLQQQAAAHASTQSVFAAEVAKGADAQLVTFAKATLPVVDAHIALDRRDVAGIASHTAKHTNPSR